MLLNCRKHSYRNSLLSLEFLGTELNHAFIVLHAKHHFWYCEERKSNRHLWQSVFDKPHPCKRGHQSLKILLVIISTKFKL